MLTFDLTKAEGFEVIHTSIVGNSVWRTAIHAWNEGVNDLAAFSLLPKKEKRMEIISAALWKWAASIW